MKRLSHSILQNLIYAIIWLVVFILPLYIYSGEGTIYWNRIVIFWVRILPFFVLFSVNNYLLVPRLLLRSRRGWYLVSVFLSVFLLFSVIQPFVIRYKLAPMIESEMGFSPEGFPRDSAFTASGFRHFHPKPEFRRHRSGDSIPGRAPFLADSLRHGTERPSHLVTGRNGRTPFPEPPVMPVLRMPVRMSAMMNDWLVAFLIVGFNIAIRYLFKSIRDERQITELQANTLQAELNYLKAQINPHFFMNTLNNIHALIDIDADKAKETVIELSKIMRYVLYEADQQGIQLSREIQFIENYVSLMRIRFADEIDIRMEFPDPAPDVRIPPMLLVTLVENAFKHGISYRRDSFIHTSLTVRDGKLTYVVENSLNDGGEGKPGVGMENMRKRLNLLFGENYTFAAKRTLEKYSITLIIPVS